MSWWALPSIFGMLAALYAAMNSNKYVRYPANLYFSLLSFLVAWWCMGQWAALPLDNYPYRYFLAKLQYIGISFSPFMWLAFALSFSGYNDWLKKFQPLLWILPSITVLAAFTNDYHHQLWRSFVVVPGQLASDIEYGTWFSVFALFAYMAVLAGTIILILRIRASSGRISQYIAVSFAPVFVLIANMAYIFGLNPMPIDPTPTGFAAAALLALVALRQKLFYVSLVARREIFKQLADGVIVIDNRLLIIDRNTSAQRLLNNDLPIGSNIDRLLPAGFLGKPENESNQMKLGDSWLDIRFSAPLSLNYHSYGRIVVIRDISQEMQTREALLSTQSQLEALNDKLDRMAHVDELTGLANRRRFYEQLNLAWSICQQLNNDLSVAIIDFDYFKQINDTFGHQAGDRVLSNAANIIQQIVRTEDLAARLGGEEFAILLPGMDLESALHVADRIRQKIAEGPILTLGDDEIYITVSIGVASLLSGKESADMLISKADEALYSSKQAGRNTVSFARMDGKIGTFPLNAK